MIEFDSVTKTVKPRGLPQREVLSGVSLQVPADRRIAVLGQVPEDRVMLIDMLAGIVLPTVGNIIRNCRVSFPVGFLGGFTPELSVRLNVAHTAQLYDVDPRSLVEFVENAAEIGRPFDKPFLETPVHLRRQLAIILAFAIPFDVYLMKSDISRIKGGPNDRFRATCYDLFEARSRSSGIIAISTPGFAREYCNMALVLHRGRLLAFDDVDEALIALDRLRYGDTLAAVAR